MPLFSDCQAAGHAYREHASIYFAGVLAFIAGGVNVVGFLATEWFASHLSGAVTGASAAVLTRNDQLAIGYIAVIMSFVAGAAWAAVLLSWSSLIRMRNRYAMALLFEGLILLAIGVMSDAAARHQMMFVPVLIIALSFLMGMQNALINRLSSAGIRTTHVTGMLTDLGVELGRLMNRQAAEPPHSGHAGKADMPKLKVLALMALLFFAGGATCTVGFQHAGCLTLLPLACMLMLLAWLPI